MIEVEHLWKVYGGRDEAPVVAVRDLSFRCEPGRVFGLIGANGAGKTTTLRILSTVLQPSSGRCRVAGHDVVAEAATVRRKIGFLSGSTGVYARMTPVEFIDYFGRLNGMSPGQCLRVVATDPGSARDIPAFLSLSSHQLEHQEEGDGQWVFLIRCGDASGGGQG